MDTKLLKSIALFPLHIIWPCKGQALQRVNIMGAGIWELISPKTRQNMFVMKRHFEEGMFAWRNFSRQVPAYTFCSQEVSPNLQTSLNIPKGRGLIRVGLYFKRKAFKHFEVLPQHLCGLVTQSRGIIFPDIISHDFCRGNHYNPTYFYFNNVTKHFFSPNHFCNCY